MLSVMSTRGLVEMIKIKAKYIFGEMVCPDERGEAHSKRIQKCEKQIQGHDQKQTINCFGVHQV